MKIIISVLSKTLKNRIENKLHTDKDRVRKMRKETERSEIREGHTYRQRGKQNNKSQGKYKVSLHWLKKKSVISSTQEVLIWIYNNFMTISLQMKAFCQNVLIKQFSLHFFETVPINLPTGLLEKPQKKLSF